MTVIYIHIRLCNIPAGNNTFQPVVSCNRQSCNIFFFHTLPCTLNGYMTTDTFCSPYIQVTYLMMYIFQKLWFFHSKVIQYICSLTIQLSCSSRFIIQSSQFGFKICISNGRTNRIRIRVLMPYHIYFLIFTHYLSTSHFFFYSM